MPRYVIKDGGTHATSFGSHVSRTVNPPVQVTFEIDARRPEGVPVGTPISDCNPDLDDVDLFPLASSSRAQAAKRIRRRAGRCPLRAMCSTWTQLT